MMMKKTWHLITLVIGIALLSLSACGGFVKPDSLGFTPTSTSAPKPTVTNIPPPTPTPTPTLSPTPRPTFTKSPTKTPTPTLPPIDVWAPGWNRDPVQSICLDVIETYPQLNNFSLPFKKTTADILSKLGFDVTSANGDCDGNLIIDVTGEVIGKEYSYTDSETKKSETKTCFLNTQVKGKMRLDTVDGGHLEFNIRGQHSPQFTFFCPEEPTTKADFDQAWPLPLLEGLSNIWGPPVLTEAMQNDNRYVREYAADLMGKFDAPATDSVPPLVKMLKDEYPQGREAAARSLGKIGPPALDAVPNLIQAYKEAESSGADWQPFQNALERTTGKKLFGADRWQAWWNEQ